MVRNPLGNIGIICHYHPAHLAVAKLAPGWFPPQIFKGYHSIYLSFLFYLCARRSSGLRFFAIFISFPLFQE